MVDGGKGPPSQRRPRDDFEIGEAPMTERYLQASLGGMLAGCAVLALAALNAHAQQSSNLSTTVEAGVTYLPPVRSGACEGRRVQFSDAFGWRGGGVPVWCTPGRGTSPLSY